MSLSADSSYDALAHEYYDPVAHPTCYNLNRLSRLFISGRLPEPWCCAATLEVGAGDSCVAAILHSRGYRLEGLELTDASSTMLDHSQRWAEFGASLTCCSADATGKRDASLSLLIASLGDPYNTRDFWAEAARIMRPGGRLFFTTPSYEWSARFRTQSGDDYQKAKFVLRDGEQLLVPSYVLPLDEQIKMIEDATFMVVAFESLGVEQLHNDEPRSPKIDVFGSNVSSLVWGFEVVRLKDSIRGRSI